MNASVHQISTAIRMLYVKNVKALNANANHHTNSLAAIVFWPDVKMVANVQVELIVFQLLAVLAIVPARKVSERNRTVHALMSMNAVKIIIIVALALNVSIDPVAMIVFVLLAMMEIHIVDNARHHNEDAHLTVSVERTRNVCSRASVFVRHRSFWIPAMVASVKIHVNDTHAESMPNVHHPIRHNVCARLALREIHFKVASMKINARHMVIRALMEPSALIKRAATNAHARMVWPAIRIKLAVFWRKVLNWFNVDIMPIVLLHWLVYKAIVLAHANHCNADQMHFVNRKIMRLGVDAVSALRKILMATVFLVSFFVSFCPLINQYLDWYLNDNFSVH